MYKLCTKNRDPILTQKKGTKIKFEEKNARVSVIPCQSIQVNILMRKTVHHLQNTH